jgi:hypothetical protein
MGCKGSILGESGALGGVESGAVKVGDRGSRAGGGARPDSATDGNAPALAQPERRKPGPCAST